MNEIKPQVYESIWNRRTIRQKIGKSISYLDIDYDSLVELCKQPQSSGQSQIVPLSCLSDDHRYFMLNYRKMFTKNVKNTQRSHSSAFDRKSYSTDDSILKSAKYCSTCRQMQSQSGNQSIERCNKSHEISDYLPRFHRQLINIDYEAVRAESIVLLRKLLRKLPVERSREEKEQLYSAMKQFSEITDQMSPHVLKVLCSVVQLDVWDEPHITLYGNSGFYLILHGRVQASVPFIKTIGCQLDIRCPTPEPGPSLPILTVGQCFGTLEPVPDRAKNSRVLTVSTLDSHCEFLLITASDFSRVTEKLLLKEEEMKLGLLQSCVCYKHWSRQSLMIIANLMRWIKFPPNTVLVKEGSTASFMGIIKSGKCDVRRNVEALVTLPSLKQVKKKREVSVGELVRSDSFGECSALFNEPMTFTVRTVTQVELALVYQHELTSIDTVTKQLMKQSCQTSVVKMSEANIQDEFVKQEMKRQWSDFKSRMIEDAVNYSGILPGYGKWKNDVKK